MDRFYPPITEILRICSLDGYIVGEIGLIQRDEDRYRTNYFSSPYKVVKRGDFTITIAES